MSGLEQSEAVLSLRGVSYRYPGADHDAVSGVNLEVQRGSCVGVLGPNGGGKTTLVRLALGMLRPTAGRVLVAGEAPEVARENGRIGYVSQRRPMTGGFPMSVRQFVELSVSARLVGAQRLNAEQREHVAWAMEVTGAAKIAGRPVGALSGGQLQRAMVARAIAPRPALLLLDEPTVGIDVAGQAAFASLLESVRGEAVSGIVVVSHDLRAVVAGCDQVACLSRTLHAHVSPQGLTPSVLAEVFAHEVEGVLGAVHVDAHLAADCDHAHDHHEHGSGGGP